VRLDGALFFGVAERVLHKVSEIEEVSVVILRMSQIQIMDATGARVIGDIVQSLEQRGITVLIKGVQERHLQLVIHVGVLRSLRHQKHLFDDMDAAVVHARSHIVRARAAAANTGV
jgi:SulP family sulfate permease